MDFRDYISELQALFTQHDLELQLNPAADPDDLRQVNEELGGSLSASLLDAWSTFGGSPTTPFFAHPSLMISFDFLPMEDALEVYEAMADQAEAYEGFEAESPRDPRISEGWFQDGWIPFGEFVGGDLLICDMSPTAKGTQGQIIAFRHDPDDIEFLASGFSHFLSLSIAALKREQKEFFENEDDYH